MFVYFSKQMPEEQAFCVFVKIMYDYGLRDLYRNNFEDLHCKFFQLEKLMQVGQGNKFFYFHKWKYWHEEQISALLP